MGRAMEPREIRNGHGERLAFTWTPGSGEHVVVLGHGVTSDKERPWSEGLSAALAAHGVASLRLAFSGNGASEGRFEDATITKEVADLGCVLDALEGRRVHYVGHSMGGAVGALRAAHDGRIETLVSLAAVTHTAEFVRRMFGHLRPGDPMLGKPQCPYGEALEADLVGLDSLVAVGAQVRVPWLLVHGSEDDVVPVQHSRDMHAAQPTSELVVLEGADHAFREAGHLAMLGVVVPWLAGRSG